MNYFDYVSTRSNQETMELFEILQDLKGYAFSIYGDRADDAIDATFEHVNSRYDESYGELENYTKSVLKNINRSEFKKESPDSENINGVWSERLTDINSPDAILEERVDQLISENEIECAKELASGYVSDFEVFKDLGSMRVSSFDKYDKVFEKYTKATIINALFYLKDNYDEVIESFLEFGKKIKNKRMKESQIQKRVEDKIKFVSLIDKTVLYDKVSNFERRFFYAIDWIEFVEEIINVDKRRISVEVEGRDFWLRPFGGVTDNEEQLKTELGMALVMAVLESNESIQLVKTKGDVFIICSTQPLKSCEICIYGMNFGVRLERLNSKERKNLC
jgi:hypothetical protein